MEKQIFFTSQSSKLLNFFIIFLFFYSLTYSSFALPITKTLIVYYYQDSMANLWQMDSTGGIHFLKNLPEGLNSATDATTSPLLSRDQNKVAYIKHGNIWILNISKNISKQATHEGFLGDKKHFPVEVMMNGWSWNGEKILYNVEPIVGGTENEKRKPKTAHHGYYFYNLQTKKSNPVSFTGIFCGWTKNNEILFQTKVGDTLFLNALDAKGKTRNIWNSSKAESLEKVSMHPNGQKVLALVGDNYTNWHQIIEIDLPTGVSNELTKKGSPGKDFLDPSYSPSGQHVAWLNQKESNIIGDQTLFVDGHIFLKSIDGMEYQWIDDQTIAITKGEELFVLRLTDGKILGRQPIDRRNLNIKKEPYQRTE